MDYQVMDEVYHNGFAAFCDGEERDDNPYLHPRDPWSRVLFRTWDRGWKDAKEQEAVE